MRHGPSGGANGREKKGGGGIVDTRDERSASIDDLDDDDGIGKKMLG